MSFPGGNMIFLGPAGFILLHSSQCRPKNTTSIIVANLLSIAIGTLVFWACGYAFAIGIGKDVPSVSSNFFLSHDRFFLINGGDSDFVSFYQEVTLLWLVLVLCNGGFVCRLRYWMYVIITLFISGFLYPCARHWTAHKKGWLKDGISIDRDGETIELKYEDNFGAGSIHVFAGSTALIGTILLAPRKERKGKKFKSIGGHLTPLMLVGGALAYVGLISLSTHESAFVNNILASQAGALVAFMLKRVIGIFGTRSGAKALISGALAGLVSCSCLGDTYYPYGGFVVGVVGGLAYVAWSSLMQLCHVDDPTDVIAVHLGAGLWAVLAGPIFKKDDGILYNGSRESFELFGWHLLGALAIFVWAGLALFIILIAFVCIGCAKYKSSDAYEFGLDAYEHKEPAYPDRDTYTQDEAVEATSSLDPIIRANPLKSYSNAGYYDNYKMRANGKQDYPNQSWQPNH